MEPWSGCEARRERENTPTTRIDVLVAVTDHRPERKNTDDGDAQVLQIVQLVDRGEIRSLLYPLGETGKPTLGGAREGRDVQHVHDLFVQIGRGVAGPNRKVGGRRR